MLFLPGEDEDQYEQFMLPLTAAFETVAQMFSTNTFNEQEAKVRKVPAFSLCSVSPSHGFVQRTATSCPKCIGGLAYIHSSLPHTIRIPLVMRSAQNWEQGPCLGSRVDFPRRTQGRAYINCTGWHDDGLPSSLLLSGSLLPQMQLHF